MKSCSIRSGNKPKSLIFFSKSLGTSWLMNRCIKSRKRLNGTKNAVNGDYRPSSSNKKRSNFRNLATLTSLFAKSLTKMTSSSLVQWLTSTVRPQCISTPSQVAKVAHNGRIIITGWTVAHQSSDVTCPKTIVLAKAWHLRTHRVTRTLDNQIWWKMDAAVLTTCDMKWNATKARVVPTSNKSKYVNSKLVWCD